ncbi:MAG: hypothetical protein JOZ38_10515, partial [Candidatus Eremiobacteraeota bacterium]|nr:hypothetical protein [Candidatus Eremiobacteraeota bacterium]
LHILVDRTVADVFGDAARELARVTLQEIGTLYADASTLAPLRFSASEAAALAFSADPAGGLWSSDPAAAMAATLVLKSLGGPAVSLVASIATRFASGPPGTYMKRELVADLRSEIFPELRNEVRTYTESVGARLESLFDSLATAINGAAEQARDEELGSIARAIALSERGGDPQREANELAARAAEIESELSAAAEIVDRFLAREPEITPADAGPEMLRRARTEARFDEETYGRGLRPQRWRVAVLGGLRRGKSSLINAFAGTRVLHDETAGGLAFPVHVRYGPQERAYALQADATWQEIEIESALDAATQNPILIETPWSLPRELVLVHVPAFDAGSALGEEIAMVAAGQASETLCLFSRQLSDRELDLYARVADLGRPVSFVHTIADNETPSERRAVIELAKQYLDERKIPVTRVFTVSTLDYANAKRERRAPAPWNELGALISTLEAHAEEHMQRLARRERLATGAPPPPAAEEPAPSAEGVRARLGRLFRRRTK